MGWRFWRKEKAEPVVEAKIVEPVAEPAAEPPPVHVPPRKPPRVDHTQDTARLLKLRQYVAGRMNAPPSMLVAPLADLAAAVEKHADAPWYASAKAKLVEIESIETRGV